MEYCFFCDKKTERDKEGNCLTCGAKDLQIGRKIIKQKGEINE